MKINLQDLTDGVADIPEKTKYWFVRTDDGRYFNTFTEENFIAIGWNNIALYELRNKRDEAIRTKLIASEHLDPNDQKTKGKITGIVNKLLIFDQLKKGDVVIIPSKNSHKLAFGIIKTGTTLTPEKLGNCEYQKRKEVVWKEIKYIDSLDNVFYKIKANRHSISNIDDFEPYINKVINTLFIKNNNVHYVIDLKTEKDVNVQSLINLIDSIQDLIDKIIIEFNLNERVEENSIKLNLQSPGQIEFKLPSGKALILLAMIISASCGQPKAAPTPPSVDKFMKDNTSTLDTINSALDDLDADVQKINSY